MVDSVGCGVVSPYGPLPTLLLHGAASAVGGSPLGIVIALRMDAHPQRRPRHEHLAYQGDYPVRPWTKVTAQVSWRTTGSARLFPLFTATATMNNGAEVAAGGMVVALPSQPTADV